MWQLKLFFFGFCNSFIKRFTCERVCLDYTSVNVSLAFHLQGSENGRVVTIGI